MALLKGLQATLIDATAGMWALPGPAAPPGQRPRRAGGSQLAWALEWGSDWGEEARTDFENATLLDPAQRDGAPRCRLVAAYRDLATRHRGWGAVHCGAVYYHRNQFAGGDPEDRVLAYTRHDGGEAIVAVHNLDPRRSRRVHLDLGWLGAHGARGVDNARGANDAPETIFDGYAALGLAAASPAPTWQGPSLQVEVGPLHSRLFRLPRASDRAPRPAIPHERSTP